VTVADAVTWLARLAALATAVAALEMIVVHRAFGDDGVFRWATLRRDLAGAPRPLRAVADLLFGTRGTWAIALLQLACALALPWLEHPAIAWLAVGCALAISIRFRGSYNGGSDAMLLVVLIALAIARSGLPLAGLAYAATQLVLSYFIAGVAKLGEPRWRDGTALPMLVTLPPYGVPARLAALVARLPRAVTWGMLAFECGFPVALVDRTACLVLLGAGALFHLANAIIFGLDRFLWTWLAAYPALLFWVDRLT